MQVPIFICVTSLFLPSSSTFFTFSLCYKDIKCKVENKQLDLKSEIRTLYEIHMKTVEEKVTRDVICN